MLKAQPMIRMHDDANRAWHLYRHADPPVPDELTRLILAQHRANFDLWHREDLARIPQASDATIVEVKHDIDRLNQDRNDRVELIDSLLVAEATPQNASAPLHSETPGLIIDRLSILSLKIYHTAEEARRSSASADHRARNQDRLRILEEQRADLATCLDQLWDQILRGERRFKLYRQMKMYNDPELNPEVYSRSP